MARLIDYRSLIEIYLLTYLPINIESYSWAEAKAPTSKG